MKDIERAKREQLTIETSPLLLTVFTANEKDKKKKEADVPHISDKNFEHVREVERRYLPSSEDGILDESGAVDDKRVSALPGISGKRQIAQVYVYAHPQERNKDDKPIRFRLRRARLYDAEGNFVREECRIACKTHAKGNDNARIETQVIIDPTDEAFSKQKAEFDILWEQGLAGQRHDGREPQPGSFERWYVRHRLPIKDKEKEHWCEIHVERRKAPPVELEGMVRIEIEFESDADEQFAKRNPSVLPSWIGKDVTGKDEYKSASLLKNGPPKEYFEHMNGVLQEKERVRLKIEKLRKKAEEKAEKRKKKEERKGVK